MLSEILRECGVVGAGGAGFPAYVKAQSQVEFLIANGAVIAPLYADQPGAFAVQALEQLFPGRRVKFPEPRGAAV